MTGRLRRYVLRTRPATLLLLALFTAVGFAQAGNASSVGRVVCTVGAVLGFLVFSVALNDLSDEAVDRVNLPTDEARPLVAGRSSRNRLGLIAVAAGAVALGLSAALGGNAVVVTAVGMVFSTAYSLPPLRLAARGVVASLVLPAGLVAVPYLLGVYSVRPYLRLSDVALLVGLYVGFVGRLLLKDFRDVRGDSMFGKRTFLVRHGRRSTCRTSAVFWTVGSLIVMVSTRDADVAVEAAWGVLLVLTWALLRSLARSTGHRRDESVISAVAITGRGAMLALLAHLSTVDAGWSHWSSALAIAAITVITVGQVREMLVTGPRLVTWRAPVDELVSRPPGSPQAV